MARRPVAENDQTLSSASAISDLFSRIFIRKSPEVVITLSAIGGRWHYWEHVAGMGYRWSPLASLVGGLTDQAESDACLRFDNASPAVCDLYDLIRVLVDTDLIPRRGRHGEPKNVDTRGRTLTFKEDGKRVEIMLHGFLENVGGMSRRGDAVENQEASPASSISGLFSPSVSLDLYSEHVRETVAESSNLRELHQECGRLAQQIAEGRSCPRCVPERDPGKTPSAP
jgi:hypothetical protein